MAYTMYNNANRNAYLIFEKLQFNWPLNWQLIPVKKLLKSLFITFHNLKWYSKQVFYPKTAFLFAKTVGFKFSGDIRKK